MTPCILGTWPSWRPERGAAAVISCLWGHHALFVSGEGEAHVEIFYFLECRERKGKGLGEGQLFKLLLIFLCVCVYAGGSGYMPACLSAH